MFTTRQLLLANYKFIIIGFWKGFKVLKHLTFNNQGELWIPLFKKNCLIYRRIVKKRLQMSVFNTKTSYRKLAFHLTPSSALSNSCKIYYLFCCIPNIHNWGASLCINMNGFIIYYVYSNLWMEIRERQILCSVCMKYSKNWFFLLAVTRSFTW